MRTRYLQAGLAALALLTPPALAQTEVPVKDFGGAGGEYRDPDVGVSFRLPPGWTLERACRWEDRQTTLWFGDPQSNGYQALYYQSPNPRPFPADAAAMDRAMRATIAPKLSQLQREGCQDCRLREGSIQMRVVGGQAAMSYLVDFTQGERKMVEYFTRIRGPRTAALFFARVPAAQLDSFRERFDRIIETLRAP